MADLDRYIITIITKDFLFSYRLALTTHFSVFVTIEIMQYFSSLYSFDVYSVNPRWEDFYLMNSPFLFQLFNKISSFIFEIIFINASFQREPFAPLRWSGKFCGKIADINQNFLVFFNSCKIAAKKFTVTQMTISEARFTEASKDFVLRFDSKRGCCKFNGRTTPNSRLISLAICSWTTRL